MRTSAIEIRPDTIADKIEANSDLLRAHWDEVALNKAVMMLKPDVERYAALERIGTLKALVAYDGDQVVGYSVNFIAHNLHYADLLMVQNDVLYVHPDYRDTRLGLRLIKATEEMGRELGARMVLWHAKAGTALDAILPRFGYGVQDVMYSKVL